MRGKLSEGDWEVIGNVGIPCDSELATEANQQNFRKKFSLGKKF